MPMPGIDLQSRTDASGVKTIEMFTGKWAWIVHICRDICGECKRATTGDVSSGIRMDYKEEVMHLVQHPKNTIQEVHHRNLEMKEFMVPCYHSDLTRLFRVSPNPAQKKSEHPHGIHNEKTPDSTEHVRFSLVLQLLSSVHPLAKPASEHKMGQSVLLSVELVEVAPKHSGSNNEVVCVSISHRTHGVRMILKVAKEQASKVSMHTLIRVAGDEFIGERKTRHDLKMRSSQKIKVTEPQKAD
ncbi:hypothetical protein BDR07DRAFT_1460435 [Suillus spraguei]|nr:hypothetical protein BDR07DRAFT_1460435 [Suillus spraguei]